MNTDAAHYFRLVVVFCLFAIAGSLGLHRLTIVCGTVGFSGRHATGALCDRVLIYAAAGIGIVCVGFLLRGVFQRFSLAAAALFPPAGGCLCALFLFSLWSSTIHLVTIGFGGLLIGLTVDQSIMAMLFAACGPPTSVKAAEKEVRSLGIMAFPLMVLALLPVLWMKQPLIFEIGVFASTGIFVSFLCLHILMPGILTQGAEQTGVRCMPLLLGKCFGSEKTTALTGLGTGLPMLCLAAWLIQKGCTSAGPFGVADAASKTDVAFWALFAAFHISIIVQSILLFFDFVLSAAALMTALLPVAVGILLPGAPETGPDAALLAAAVVVSGLGMRFSIVFIRAMQRYSDKNAPAIKLIRITVFITAMMFATAVAILITTASVPVFHRFGAALLTGIAFQILGIFVLLPPVVKFRLGQLGRRDVETAAPAEFVINRFRPLAPFPRLFARFKLLMDPMFMELPRLLSPETAPVRVIIDIGSGYGVPAAFCLGTFPNAGLYGIEPDSEKVRIASQVLGGRGRVIKGAAPSVPQSPAPADLALVLDMAHYLSDPALSLLLSRLYRQLGNGGRLVLRAALPLSSRFSLSWWIEEIRLRLLGAPACYRSGETLRQMVAEAGFSITHAGYSGGKQDLFWIAGTRAAKPGAKPDAKPDATQGPGRHLA